MTPSVSVIVPTYNGEAFIAEALASLTADRDEALEVMVVDDGSHDPTRSIVAARAAADPRIRMIEAEHGGVAAARNRGLAEAAAPFVAFLDQDDLKPAGTFSRQAARLAADPDALGIVGETEMFAREDGGERRQRVLTTLLGAGLFRRAVFERFGGFDGTLDMGSDYDFYLRLLEAGAPIRVEPELALRHRRHSDNTSGDVARVRLELLRVARQSLLRRREGGAATAIRHPLLDAMRAQWGGS